LEVAGSGEAKRIYFLGEYSITVGSPFYKGCISYGAPQGDEAV